MEADIFNLLKKDLVNLERDYMSNENLTLADVIGSHTKTAEPKTNQKHFSIDNKNVKEFGELLRKIYVCAKNYAYVIKTSANLSKEDFNFCKITAIEPLNELLEGELAEIYENNEEIINVLIDDAMSHFLMKNFSANTLSAYSNPKLKEVKLTEEERVLVKEFKSFADKKKKDRLCCKEVWFIDELYRCLPENLSTNNQFVDYFKSQAKDYNPIMCDALSNDKTFLTINGGYYEGSNLQLEAIARSRNAFMQKIFVGTNAIEKGKEYLTENNYEYGGKFPRTGKTTKLEDYEGINLPSNVDTIVYKDYLLMQALESEKTLTKIKRLTTFKI